MLIIIKSIMIYLIIKIAYCIQAKLKCKEYVFGWFKHTSMCIEDKIIVNREYIINFLQSNLSTFHTLVAKFPVIYIYVVTFTEVFNLRRFYLAYNLGGHKLIPVLVNNAYCIS